MKDKKRDISPTKDIFTAVIQPLNWEKQFRAEVQLRKGGLLYWPGQDKAYEYKGVALKIGENQNCTVTLA